MSLTWQEIIVLILVVLAAAYLVLRVWLSLTARAKPGCGSCASTGCPSTGEKSGAPVTRPLVQLENPQGVHALAHGPRPHDEDVELADDQPLSQTITRRRPR